MLFGPISLRIAGHALDMHCFVAQLTRTALLGRWHRRCQTSVCCRHRIECAFIGHSSTPRDLVATPARYRSTSDPPEWSVVRFRPAGPAGWGRVIQFTLSLRSDRRIAGTGAEPLLPQGRPLHAARTPFRVLFRPDFPPRIGKQGLPRKPSHAAVHPFLRRASIGVGTTMRLRSSW